MIQFVTMMGEGLDQKEIDYLVDLAKSSDRPDMIDIAKITEILVPTENIMDTLKEKLADKQPPPEEKQQELSKILDSEDFKAEVQLMQQNTAKSPGMGGVPST